MALGQDNKLSIKAGRDLYTNIRRTKDSKNYTFPPKWPVSPIHRVGRDELRAGYFDLCLGEYQLQFLVGDILRTAIDDVQILWSHNGKFELINPVLTQKVCTRTEFRCDSDSVTEHHNGKRCGLLTVLHFRTPVHHTAYKLGVNMQGMDLTGTGCHPSVSSIGGARVTASAHEKARCPGDGNH
ncbi:hypothetical protein DPMN_123505 [Dreissena polymorpha]|uniref:Uncharacterized protein n=1 Tax=Dreissena polymorpha TaxID=45954 RepID=A0A9D4GRQ4_DREPO|nr:hypothetical protein DPMN_123505 [Dreissena polymorpha]